MTEIIYDSENIISDTEGLLIQKSKNPPKKFKEIFYSNPSEFIDFFTDGSKQEESNFTGAALYSPNLNLSYKYKINKFASIFTAESYAILQTLNTILERNITKARIFTDSLSVIKAISNFSPLKSKNTSYLTLEIKKQLSSIIEQNGNIKIFWIPSHSNIESNDIADNLAKEAINSGILSNLLIPYTDLYETIKKTSQKSFQNSLDSQKHIKGVKYFESYYNVSPKPWFYNSIFPRYHITSMNRIRANHYSLAESLHRKNIVNSERCKCGFREEDIEHVVLDCPLYNNQRNTLIKKLKNNKQPFPINLQNILQKPDSKDAKFVTEFLNACQLCV